MKQHVITVSGKGNRVITPIRISKIDELTLLEGYSSKEHFYKKVVIDCSKITHFDGIEIFEVVFVRPLSHSFFLINNPMLKIVLDNREAITSIEVVMP